MGETLAGRYRIDRYLARGGMSTVFAGMDLRLERPVAIKVMSPEYAADPTFLTRFEREARAAAKLDDPHVVGVFDQDRDGDLVFLVMELVDGGTLRDLLHQQGPLSVPVALSVLEPVLRALAAAHAAGLVHRDVKPENVLISRRGEVKVADFGLVRAVTSTTMATGNVILGTVAYLSPEQVATGAADERSDVYSAGIVAYEMLTGATPFDGENAISVAYQHVHSDVPSVTRAAPGVPQPVADAIDAATRRDPLQRPANAADLLDRLRRARKRVGLSLTSVPVPRPVAPTPRSPTRPQPTATARPRSTEPAGAPPPRTRGSTRELATSQVRHGRAGRTARDRWRIRLISLAIVLAVAAAASFGGWWLADRWTSMPPVTDLPVPAAVAAVESAELVPTVVTDVHDVVPSGAVAGSDPQPGTKQRPGSTVTLTASAGRPTVPRIAPGSDVTDAFAAIRDQRLTPVVDDGRDIHDDTIPAGAVVRTDPAAGAQLDVGSSVTVIRSLGPAPVEIPAVDGKLPEDAANKLIVAGLRVGSERRVFDPDHEPGIVIGTQPPSGQSAPHGSAVDLLIADSLTVPTPESDSVTDVVAQLRADGFDATVGLSEFAATVPGGEVIRLEPAPGTRIDPADPAVVVIGSNAVTVPRLVGMTVLYARSVLTDQGLAASVRALFGSSSSVVTDQRPAAGALVAPGSTVDLDAWP